MIEKVYVAVVEDIGGKLIATSCAFTAELEALEQGKKLYAMYYAYNRPLSLRIMHLDVK